MSGQRCGPQTVRRALCHDVRNMKASRAQLQRALDLGIPAARTRECRDAAQAQRMSQNKLSGGVIALHTLSCRVVSLP